MLSCLTRQAKLLEKELKDLRKETIKLRRETEEAQATVKIRDERIEALEAQLNCLQEEHAKCGQPEPPQKDLKEEVPNEQVDELLAKVTELGQLLGGKSRKLTVGSSLRLPRFALTLTCGRVDGGIKGVHARARGGHGQHSKSATC